LQALPTARTVGPGIATLAVVAERALARVLTGRLAVAARRFTLGLIEIAGAALILIGAGAILLVQAGLLGAILRPIELLAPVLWTVGLLRAGLRAVVLRRVRAVVVVLRLIVFLVEIGSGEIVVRGVIEIVGAVIAVDVVAIDVVGVDVVAVHVVDVHIVAIDVGLIVVAYVSVVVVVAIHERVGIGDVHVTVVNDRRTVPAASPRVPTPPAAMVIVRDDCPDRNTHAEGDNARGCHVTRRIAWVRRHRRAVHNCGIVGGHIDNLWLRGLNNDRLRRRLHDDGLRRR